MATFTAILNNGLSFNIKAQTIQQATKKVSDLLIHFPKLSNSFDIELHSKHSDCFNRSLPFVTMAIKKGATLYRACIINNFEILNKLLTAAYKLR